MLWLARRQAPGARRRADPIGPRAAFAVGSRSRSTGPTARPLDRSSAHSSRQFIAQSARLSSRQAHLPHRPAPIAPHPPTFVPMALAHPPLRATAALRALAKSSPIPSRLSRSTAHVRALSTSARRAQLVGGGGSPSSSGSPLVSSAGNALSGRAKGTPLVPRELLTVLEETIKVSRPPTQATGGQGLAELLPRTAAR